MSLSKAVGGTCHTTQMSLRMLQENQQPVMERSKLLLLIGLEVVVALSLLRILPNQQDRAVFCCIVSKEGDN